MKQRSLTRKFFRSHALVLLIGVLMVSFVSGILFSRYASSKTIDAREALINSLGLKIESIFKMMDEFSRSFGESSEVKKLVINKIPEVFRNGTGISRYMVDLYQYANRMFIDNLDVSFHTKDGVYIWMGSNFLVKKTAEKFVPPGYGFHEFSFQRNNPNLIGNIGCEADNRPSVVLSRALSMSYKVYNPRVIMKVYLPSEILASWLDKYQGHDVLNFSILNRTGSLLYGSSVPALQWLGNYARLGGLEYHRIKLLGGNIQFVVNYHYISVLRFILVCIGFTIGMFLIIAVPLLVISYHQARSIAKPITDICYDLGLLKLGGQFVSFQEHKTDVIELNQLCDSIDQMQTNLSEALDKIVKLESFEIHSRLLALQAQIQPHFIYNCLMTISSLSEDNEKEKVSLMCNNMTSMLRYVSESAPEGTVLVSEINYLNSYASIMSNRFPGLVIDDQLPVNMLDIVVPKLIIQPLVENSIKYCGRNDPHIIISGDKEGRKWSLTVTNDGDPFDPEVVIDIKRKCRELRENPRDLSFSIDGMGLVNIYSRLLLRYGVYARFEIEVSGGLNHVTIGGILL